MPGLMWLPALGGAPPAVRAAAPGLAWLIAMAPPAVAAPELPRVPLEEALGIYLAADAQVADLSEGRIDYGRIPQDYADAAPALCYRVLTRNPIQSLDGESGLVKARVEMHVVGRADLAEALAFAARSAMARLRPQVLMGGLRIASAWTDQVVAQPDALPSGADSDRTDYVTDCLLSYYELAD